MEPSEFTNWLLAADTPSIRYFTLRDLLNRAAGDPDVQAARTAIMQTGPVPAILEKQTPEGNWEGERDYYSPKYVSTHWSMLLMAELAADPADERLQRGVEFMLAATAQRALDSHAPDRQDIVCFWANVLRYSLYAGRGDDPRIAPMVETLELAAQVRAWGCRYNDQLPCAWGVIRELWGLAALPESLRPPGVQAAIRSAAEFVFGSQYSLLEGNYPTEGTVSKHWARLNYPLYYQADVLLALRAAAELDLFQLPQVQAALRWLAGRRASDGRWSGTSPYRSTSWKVLGGKAETDRWVSLQAATILKQAGMPLD